jgi:hypothetical protein
MWQLALTVVIAQAAAAPATVSDPVSAQNAIVVVDSPAAEPVVAFDVVNKTNGTITAWKVALMLQRRDGSTQRLVIGSDAHIAYAGLVPDPGAVLYPNGSVRGTTTVSTPASNIQNVTAALVCAVFADGTWLGVPDEVDQIFQQRQTNYEALTEIVTSLRAARASGQGADALRDAIDRLNRPGQKDHSLKERMRGNIQMALRPSAKPVPPEQLLAEWILQSEARLQATEAHRHKAAQATIK